TASAMPKQSGRSQYSSFYTVRCCFKTMLSITKPMIAPMMAGTTQPNPIEKNGDHDNNSSNHCVSTPNAFKPSYTLNTEVNNKAIPYVFVEPLYKRWKNDMTTSTMANG